MQWFYQFTWFLFLNLVYICKSIYINKENISSVDFFISEGDFYTMFSNSNVDNTPSESKLYIHDNAESLSKDVIKNIHIIANQAIERDNVFIIALSGGSIPKLLRELYTTNTNTATQFDKWRYLFIDERFVSNDHIDSNYYNFKINIPLFDAIPPEHIIQISEELVKSNNLFDAAKEYEHLMDKMVSSNPSKCIHLSILGMGPDGHTASLFPSHISLFNNNMDTVSKILPIENSPKPPSKRITMSLDWINNSENIYFIITGSTKADKIADMIFRREFILEEQRELENLVCIVQPDLNIPASLVHTKDKLHDVQFYLDADAASKITRKRVSNQ